VAIGELSLFAKCIDLPALKAPTKTILKMGELTLLSELWVLVMSEVFSVGSCLNHFRMV
jgi:hypothetical protein